MKAKDYLQRIKASEDKRKELAVCVREMILEASEIAANRHTESDSALASILKEQELKYHALCRLVDKQEWDFCALPEGFRETIKAHTPNLYNMLWG